MKIYGNKRALERLKQYDRSGRMPHSLLFCGDEGTGKKLLADYAAMLYFCGGIVRPCMKCSDCRRIGEHIHPDVIYADCGDMSVTELRELLRRSFSMPVEGKLTVFILTNFHLANSECQNALLTYLEEPSDKVRFILTASEKNAVLSTILSRTALIPTEPLSVRECTEALAELGYSENASELAKLFGGNLGQALKAANDKNGTLYFDLAKEYITALLEYREYNALEVMHRVPQPKDDKRGPLKAVINAVAGMIHDSLMISQGGLTSCGCDADLSFKLERKYPPAVLNAMCAEARRFSDITASVNFNPALTANAFTAALFRAAENKK